MRKKSLTGYMCFCDDNPVIWNDYSSLTLRSYQKMKIFSKRKDAKQYADDVRKVRITIEKRNP